MRDRDGDTFYIGYRNAMPEFLRGFVRARVAVTLAMALCAGVIFAALQGPFPAKRFEYGTEREFVGWIREAPVPQLVVPEPLQLTWSVYLLSEAGTKLGAQRRVAGLDGALVRARGTLIYREDHTMLDIGPDSLERLAPGGQTGTGAPLPGLEELGRHRLVGEIVDSKCFLGVMNPATGKTHRACAARCLSGGNPPLLLVRSSEGPDLQLLLVGPQGESLHRAVLPFVAEPVEIEGRVSRFDHLLVLWADPATLRRL